MTSIHNISRAASSRRILAAAISSALNTAADNSAPIAVSTDAYAPDPIPANRNPLISTKTYGHDLGLSVAFRQWRAASHCRFVHGYALGVKFVFSALELDHCGWVVDFGGLKDLKELLVTSFDHKLVVAHDDPARASFEMLHAQGLADVVIFPATGCEAFSRMIYDATEVWLKDAGFSPRVTLVSVEVSEHGGNSAICQG